MRVLQAGENPAGSAKGQKCNVHGSTEGGNNRCATKIYINQQAATTDSAQRPLLCNTPNSCFTKAQRPLPVACYTSRFPSANDNPAQLHYPVNDPTAHHHVLATATAAAATTLWQWLHSSLTHTDTLCSYTHHPPSCLRHQAASGYQSTSLPAPAAAAAATATGRS
jgi:hypothetical protein